MLRQLIDLVPPAPRLRQSDGEGCRVVAIWPGRARTRGSLPPSMCGRFRRTDRRTHATSECRRRVDRRDRRRRRPASCDAPNGGLGTSDLARELVLSVKSILHSAPSFVATPRNRRNGPLERRSSLSGRRLRLRVVNSKRTPCQSTPIVAATTDSFRSRTVAFAHQGRNSG
jgi:hypothetical protein